ncbi:hypothetical protein [Frankia sp. QA3]|uniref:hypothetical protein n=1 Tax=Frankia sp. QA3 TaxID=710111 RepID=UPI000269BF64|nr:hypothetical protein [Frankia sp. QA3]EIV92433.1 hypothetical protein FraQA3DRAFT_1996 [Frankia sp. QA3]
MDGYAADRHTWRVDDLKAAWYDLQLTGKVHVSLPHLAAEALAAGFDGPMLRELAGLGIRDDLEALRLLPMVLAESGCDLGSGEESWGEIMSWASSRDRFEPDLVARTEQALAVVQRDLDRTGAKVGRLTLHWTGRFDDDGEPQLLLGFDGEPFRGGGDPPPCVGGPDLPRTVLSVAAGVQECIMELFVFFWPECPLHRRGLHLPESDSEWAGAGWPAWRCRGAGGHDIALLGRLCKGVSPIR